MLPKMADLSERSGWCLVWELTPLQVLSPVLVDYRHNGEAYWVQRTAATTIAAAIKTEGFGGRGDTPFKLFGITITLVPNEFM